jgi:hypothetical protein
MSTSACKCTLQGFLSSKDLVQQDVLTFDKKALIEETTHRECIISIRAFSFSRALSPSGLLSNEIEYGPLRISAFSPFVKEFFTGILYLPMQ